MSQTQKQLTQKDQMLRGTFWSTISDFISRLLGALYIIPWFYWMGQFANEANALFSMGYNIYATILLFSTSGINVALSKQIARYSVQNQTETIAALINGFLKLMVVSGLFFSTLMYFTSPLLSEGMGLGHDLVPILHSLCLSVLVFPAMSTIRGIFQGYANLKPNALSQIWEQIIRVIWMLLTTYMIMQVGNGDYKVAVMQSTLAAFIGMVASVVVLLYFLKKEGLFHLLKKPKSSTLEIDVTSLVIETFKEAIPFIIIGSAIQAYQLIDQMTYIRVMESVTNFDVKRLMVLYSYMSANPNKIVMILISIVNSIGGISIPLLTANFLKKDHEASASLLQHNIKLMNLFIIPALTGALLLSNELYTIFYSQPESIALQLFNHALIQTLFLSVYGLLSPTLLAFFEGKRAISYFLIGFIVKLILQIPFIYLFHSNGPLVATSLATLTAIILMYRRIHQLVGLDQSLLIKHLIQVLFATILMGTLVFLGRIGLDLFLIGTGKLTMLIKLVLLSGIGVLTYGYLTLRSQILDDILGTKANSLRRKFNITPK
ncbi:TPA: oligosaccharide flippase family protein [Streptococcus suis]